MEPIRRIEVPDLVAVTEQFNFSKTTGDSQIRNLENTVPPTVSRKLVLIHRDFTERLLVF